jgi:hypothetical protein
VIFLYGNESYTDTITLESSGGLILFSPEECPMSIELIVLCILTIMAILCLFIGWYYQSPSFILLAGLFIMIVGAFILMNGIPLLTGAENSEGVITCTYDTGRSSYLTILGLIITLSGLLLTVYSIF